MNVLTRRKPPGSKRRAWPEVLPAPGQTGAMVKSRADHAVAFIRGLTLSTDGLQPWAGMPFDLQPWQEAIVREVFGRVRADDRTRRAYRTAFLALPRKNGKSEIAAAVALYGLIGDGVRRGQVYSAAGEKEQAALVFNAAAAMVEQDPELEARIDIQRSRKRMTDKVSGSFYQALSAESYSKHGFNSSMVVFDELHTQANRDLWDVLRTSMGARLEPLIVAITTAGEDRTSICWQVWDYARKVRDGVIDDPAFYPVLFEAGQDAAWDDEAVWAACNPALGVFRDVEEMRALALEASHSLEARATFRRLYLNQWVEGVTQWIDMSRWAACPAIDPADAVGRPSWAGLDLGLRSDLSAFVAVTLLDDGRCLVRSRIWMPEGARDRFRERPYDTWQASGALTITAGDVTDFGRIAVEVAELCEQWGVIEVAYDDRFAEPLIQSLDLPEVDLVQQLQGYALNVGLRALEDHVIRGTLGHNGNPVLRWMASNAVVETGQRGDIAIVKRKNREKIDGIVALSMALQRAVLHTAPIEDEPSSWEDPNYTIESGEW